MLRPRTQRLRFAFAPLATCAAPRRISLQFWHSSFRLSRKHFRRTSRAAASQPSPRTQRLRFTFARLATRAQVIFCKAARAAAIALPPAPQRLCPTRQYLRHTRRRPSIFPAHFRKIAPFPVKMHGMPRAFRALRRRAAFPAAFRQAAPFPGMLRPLAAFLARICCITPFPCKKRGVFPFPAPANSAFSPYCAIFSHACRPAEARSPQRTTAARKKAYA